MNNMNERISISIKEARKALNAVNLVIPAYPIGSASREILENTAVVLESLILKLVHEDIKETADKWKQQQEKLQELAHQMEAADSSLGKITGAIEKVSHMIGTLASL